MYRRVRQLGLPFLCAYTGVWFLAGMALEVARFIL
jgi:hypothetical protein